MTGSSPATTVQKGRLGSVPERLQSVEFLPRAGNPLARPAAVRADKAHDEPAGEGQPAALAPQFGQQRLGDSAVVQ